MKDERKILVSGCLYGWTCRYDAKNVPCTDERFLKWKKEGRLVPVCPEVFGGLSTPRDPSEIKGTAKQSIEEITSDLKVVSSAGKDVTAEYVKGAKEALRLALEHDVAFCIMKAKSPSCGNETVYDGTFSGRLIPGEGVTVRMLRKAGFAVYSEKELDKIEE